MRPCSTTKGANTHSWTKLVGHRQEEHSGVMPIPHTLIPQSERTAVDAKSIEGTNGLGELKCSDEPKVLELLDEEE